MQENIADLSDMLQKLNKQKRPKQSELKHSAKSFGLPQVKDGLNIDVQTLLQDIQQAFLQEVEYLRDSSCGEHRILQEVLELGRLPKEFRILTLKPNSQNVSSPFESAG